MMSDLKYLLVVLMLFCLGACVGESDQSNSETQTAHAQVNTDSNTVEKDSVQLIEIKLIDPQDDSRGYCVDLFDHLTRAQPIAGLQGHNCFLYFGVGPTEDQGFDLTFFEQTGQFKLAHFDKCMEVHDPNPSIAGSFVALEECIGSPVQTFELSNSGAIRPLANSELCLTIGELTVPGGPRVVPPGLDFIFPPENNDEMHTIRRLTFETCSSELANRQQWEFRSGEYSPDENAAENRFIY